MVIFCVREDGVKVEKRSRSDRTRSSVMRFSERMMWGVPVGDVLRTSAFSTENDASFGYRVRTVNVSVLYYKATMSS